MTVGQIFTKIGSFIENKQIFMLLNCSGAKHANFEDFKHAKGSRFFSWTQCTFSNNKASALAIQNSGTEAYNYVHLISMEKAR